MHEEACTQHIPYYSTRLHLSKGENRTENRTEIAAKIASVNGPITFALSRYCLFHLLFNLSMNPLLLRSSFSAFTNANHHFSPSVYIDKYVYVIQLTPHWGFSVADYIKYYALLT